MIKNPFCRPRLRSRKTLPAMSLLDRLREAVFRLIMLSALSKGSSSGHRSSAAQPSDHYHYPSDPHHSEAVADCIEFIKKSATASDETRDSTAGGYADSAAAAQVVIPLPVYVIEAE